MERKAEPPKTYSETIVDADGNEDSPVTDDPSLDGADGVPPARETEGD